LFTFLLIPYPISSFSVTDKVSSVQHLLGWVADGYLKLYYIDESSGVKPLTPNISSFFSLFSPSFWSGTVLAMHQKQSREIRSALKERAELELKINLRKQALAVVQKEWSVIERLDYALLSSKNEFATIAKRIGGIATLWSKIQSDVNQIETILELAQPSSRTFGTRLDNAKKMYLLLGEALHAYEERIIHVMA